MSATVVIEGVTYTVEKLANGNIRVSHRGHQFNAMHGPGTDGEVWWQVHPCQRNQYDLLDHFLPPAERGVPAGVDKDQRPWWSLSAGERAGLRE